MKEKRITLKRFQIFVQHEIFVYGPNEQAAKQVAVNAYVKAKCISIKQVPFPEDEIRQPVVDNRTAPGS